jgi:RimJ/RimL family protein N-acetyltransferase
MIIEKHTPRFLIRNLRENDRLFYSQIYRDPVLTKYIGGPIPREIITRSFDVKLNEWNPSSNFTLTLVITNRFTGKTIGLCGLKMSNVNSTIAEPGIIITKDNWSKGYASEIFDELVNLCFGGLNLTALEGSPNRNNEQSIKLITKLGYVFKKHFDLKLSYLNEKIPSSLYILTKEKYFELRRTDLN